MTTPTREQFVKAWVAVMAKRGGTVEEANALYDLFTGPPEEFTRALRDWAETRGREIAGEGGDR